MKQTINRSDFHRAFQAIRPDNFTHEGRIALFEYLEQLEEDLGEVIELDVIALCCDYSEDSIENVLKEHNLDSLDDLRDNTTVIEIDDETIIYQVF